MFFEKLNALLFKSTTTLIDCTPARRLSPPLASRKKEKGPSKCNARARAGARTYGQTTTMQSAEMYQVDAAPVQVNAELMASF